LTPFEYVIPLISVIVGLGITDVASSLNKLFQARDRVRWDWLPLAITLLAVSLLLQAWWTFYALGYGGTILITSLGGFMLLCISLISLYLFAAASLPSEVPEEGVDLREFYKANSRYIWGAFIMSVTLATLSSTIKLVSESAPVSLAPVFLNVSIVGLGVVLMVSKSRQVHSVIVGVMVLVLTVASGALILEAV